MVSRAYEDKDLGEMDIAHTICCSVHPYPNVYGVALADVQFAGWGAPYTCHKLENPAMPCQKQSAAPRLSAICRHCRIAREELDISEAGGSTVRASGVAPHGLPKIGNELCFLPAFRIPVFRYSSVSHAEIAAGVPEVYSAF